MCRMLLSFVPIEQQLTATCSTKICIGQSRDWIQFGNRHACDNVTTVCAREKYCLKIWIWLFKLLTTMKEKKKETFYSHMHGVCTVAVVYTRWRVEHWNSESSIGFFFSQYFFVILLLVIFRLKIFTRTKLFVNFFFFFLH